MKIVFAAVALTMAPLAAFGADLGLRKSYPASPQTPAAPTWTGAYVGVNGGWGYGMVKDPYVTPAYGALKESGWLGGAQVGYNHQIGDYVFGLEADYALGRATGNKPNLQSTDFGAYHLNGKASVESTFESFGSLRARAGVAMNSVLLFATAGYAFGVNKITASALGTYTVSGASKPASDAGADKKRMDGWTLGGGAEYAFSQHVSGKVEYLYADLGKATVFNNTWAEDQIRTKFNLIRAGVNYHF